MVKKIMAFTLMAIFGLSAAWGGEIYSKNPVDQFADYTGMAVSGEVKLTNNYIFRGVSFSNDDPAIIGNVNFDWSYLFAGVQASSTSSEITGYSEFKYQAGVKADFSASNDVKFTGKAGYIWYTYPGKSDTNFEEVFASIGSSFYNFDVDVSAYFPTSNTESTSLVNRVLTDDAAYEIKIAKTFDVIGGVTISGSAGTKNKWGNWFSGYISNKILGFDVSAGYEYIDYDDSSNASIFVPHTRNDNFVVSISRKF